MKNFLEPIGAIAVGLLIVVILMVAYLVALLSWKNIFGSAERRRFKEGEPAERQPAPQNKNETLWRIKQMLAAIKAATDAAEENLAQIKSGITNLDTQIQQLNDQLGNTLSADDQAALDKVVADSAALAAAANAPAIPAPAPAPTRDTGTPTQSS